MSSTGAATPARQSSSTPVRRCTIKDQHGEASFGWTTKIGWHRRQTDLNCKRLARSARHLSELVDLLESKRVGLRILNFGGDAVDTRSATGRLMLNMFAAMAQFEREIMLERQREGIAKAKADGKYKGRKPTARAKAEDAVQMFRAGKRVAHIAKELGIGRGSVYRALEAAGLTGGS